MKVEQFTWTEAETWKPFPPGSLGPSAQLVMIFCGTAFAENRY